MGDFNSTRYTKEYNLMRDIVIDTCPMNNNIATIHGFGDKAGKKIDYIFVSENASIRGYDVLREKYWNLCLQKDFYPSDHYPVYCEIQFDGNYFGISDPWLDKV